MVRDLQSRTYLPGSVIRPQAGISTKTDSSGFAIPDSSSRICDPFPRQEYPPIPSNYHAEAIDMPQHFRVFEGFRPHFITSAIVHWMSVFSREDYFRILADSLKYCSECKGLQIHGYVIMPTYFHALFSQLEGKLSDVIRDMKKHTSKEIARKLSEDGRELWLSAMERAAGNRDGITAWQEAFHPEQVHTESFFNQKLDYIHNNPVRAGYIDDPCDWKYSSAGFYHRETESVVPITPVLWGD